MHQKFDLGSQTFCSQTSGLELTVSNSADLMLSAECLELGSSEKIEQLLFSREIWVTQAPEFSIYIRIGLQPGCQLPPATLFSQVGHIICNAKVGVMLSTYVFASSLQSHLLTMALASFADLDGPRACCFI